MYTFLYFYVCAQNFSLVSKIQKLLKYTRHLCSKWWEINPEWETQPSWADLSYNMRSIQQFITIEKISYKYKILHYYRECEIYWPLFLEYWERVIIASISFTQRSGSCDTPRSHYHWSDFFPRWSNDSQRFPISNNGPTRMHFLVFSSSQMQPRVARG